MSRSSLLHTLPLTAATALTSIVAFLAWGTFYERAGDLLVPLAGGIVLVSVLGVLSRLARLPAVVVVGVQLLGIFLAANVVWGSSAWPTPDSLTEVVRHLDASISSLGQWAPPVPGTVDEAVAAPLLGALVLHLLVDFFAVTLRRVPLAGLPLLAIQTVPISVHEDVGVHWLLFAATAACFLLMLCLQESIRIGNWGRVFGTPRDNDIFRAFDGVDPGRHPVAIGTVAVVAALVVSLAVPTFSLALFNGDGSGGGGDNEVQITNPMADLHRDLQRGEDIPLMQVTAVGIRPTYLRITALTQYSGGTWRPGDRDLPAANAATGPVPAPVGLESRVPRENRDMTVQINDSFSSLWLPTPLVVSQARAGTDWRYDRSVMDFHSAEDDITTAGLSYELVESRPEIDQEALAGARPPTSSMVRDYTSLPDDLPEIVHRLAEEVTDGRESSYDKAVALQNWFRSPENFTYSLETDEGAVVGNGNAALQRFLSEDGRVGYCEQFAASMALMARSLGIPARVSVGLLRPDRIATDTYEFSSHDMHAWPELWFDGYGWVMFEPTPQDRATVVPEYTVGSGEDGPRPNEPTEAPTTSAPSQDPTQEPTQEPTAPEDAAPARKGSEKDGFNLAWLGLIPVALLLLLLPVAPGWVRRRRTHRRLATGDVEQAWLEVHDVASDLGRAWPEHRSPRDTGRAVMDWLGAVPPPAREQRPATGPLANPTAAQAVERLVALLERERYAPASAPPDRTELAELVRTSTAALHAGATPRARRRATWFPRSVLSK